MIDPRYLVRLDTLPFEPAGAPTVGWCPCSVSPLAAWCYTCHVWPDRCLDLSAPPERDGIPERLDALGWALAVLAKRVGILIDAIRAMDWADSTVWSVRAFGGRCVTILSPGDDGWEGFDMNDPNQLRRIVAAALRKTHVQTESP